MRRHYKLNTDGTAKGKPDIGRIGGVFRTNNEDWVQGYMENMPHTTNIVTELTTLLKGLQIAERNGWIPLEVATDSTEVIRLLIIGNITYDPIICECKLLIQRMTRVVVRHSYKEQNRVTDALAKEEAKIEFFWKNYHASSSPGVCK
ncbi:PREDICTED: uncharacterized protein LOC109224248 [Nicotiana attenuata]|uniref:uncharacterized protein LOC109224248 n=1 Tax=Nicotiana attenuata TaxID=49451 RepID=UPI0009055DE3|nr:PREDICTED: uncharacterized protein LOC109224248 [Nicotiana attenuata]